MAKSVTIYTDGACSYNPGPGGWGAILIYGKNKKEICGGENDTTNNRMELMAVIKALDMLKEGCDVTLYSDSAYVINAFNNGWLMSWQSNGWKTSTNKPVSNKDLWGQLLVLLTRHTLTWKKVKGHSDNEFNNRCDELARSQIKINN